MCCCAQVRTVPIGCASHDRSRGSQGSKNGRQRGSPQAIAVSSAGRVLCCPAPQPVLGLLRISRSNCTLSSKRSKVSRAIIHQTERDSIASRDFRWDAPTFAKSARPLYGEGEYTKPLSGLPGGSARGRKSRKVTQSLTHTQ